MNDQQIKIFVERLLNEQAELLGIADLVDESANTVKLDQSSIGRLSRMDAMQQQAMAMASQDRQRFRLNRIKTTLHRIDDGEFGECVECLEIIPVARLEIDPSIEHCVNCASKKD